MHTVTLLSGGIKHFVFCLAFSHATDLVVRPKAFVQHSFDEAVNELLHTVVSHHLDLDATTRGKTAGSPSMLAGSNMRPIVGCSLLAPRCCPSCWALLCRKSSASQRHQDVGSGRSNMSLRALGSAKQMQLDGPGRRHQASVAARGVATQGGGDVCRLGVGTIWCGRKWPPQNDAYVDPDDAEVETFLGKALTSLTKGGERVIVDTAAGYGSAEERIGQFFRTPTGAALLPNVIIHTKFGHSGHGDPLTEKLTVDILRACWNRSASVLPRIDGLYYHMTSSMPEEMYMATLRDAALTEELSRLRNEEASGLKYLGAAISNAKVLGRAWREGLLAHLDVLQLSQSLARQEPDLLSEIHASGKVIVVNSPVRSFSSSNGTCKKEFKDCYTELWSMPYVSVVLTGTRNHIDDTIGFYESGA